MDNARVYSLKAEHYSEDPHEPVTTGGVDQGLSPEEIITVKEASAEIRVEKEVTEERLHPLLEKRNGLTYGRLFLDRSASSFEVYIYTCTHKLNLLTCTCATTLRSHYNNWRLKVPCVTCVFSPLVLCIAGYVV